MTEQQSKDLAYIKHFEGETEYMRSRYLERMNNKEFSLADQINDIIKMYQQEFSNARNDYAKDYGSEVFKASSPRDTSVFVIKK